MHKKIHTANTILATLPYIKKFSGKKIVIKYGGAAQVDENLKELFAQDIVLLSLVGVKPIIVHGGGPEISEMLEKLKLQTKFIDGLRVTTKDVFDIAQMILCGKINKEITNLLNKHGAKAIGISGKDANLFEAKPLDFDKYGLVGEITNVNHEVLQDLLNSNFIPIIAPIAYSNEPNISGLNINADFCASEIAKSIQAQKIIFLTDTRGVLDENLNLLSSLNKNDIEKLKQTNVIKGGMIPKTKACIDAINAGVKNAHIIDGRIKHSILLELFTNEGIGTIIK